MIPQRFQSVPGTRAVERRFTCGNVIPWHWTAPLQATLSIHILARPLRTENRISSTSRQLFSNPASRP